jgi:hypothetical protein
MARLKDLKQINKIRNPGWGEICFKNQGGDFINPFATLAPDLSIPKEIPELSKHVQTGHLAERIRQ